MFSRKKNWILIHLGEWKCFLRIIFKGSILLWQFWRIWLICSSFKTFSSSHFYILYLPLFFIQYLSLFYHLHCWHSHDPIKKLKNIQKTSRTVPWGQEFRFSGRLKCFGHFWKKCLRKKANYENNHRSVQLH